MPLSERLSIMVGGLLSSGLLERIGLTTVNLLHGVHLMLEEYKKRYDELQRRINLLRGYL